LSANLLALFRDQKYSIVINDQFLLSLIKSRVNGDRDLRMAQRTVNECIELIFSGQRARARDELFELIKGDPRDDMAWLALSLCVDQPLQKRDCIQRALFLNPNNVAAQQALQTLEDFPPGAKIDGQITSPENRLKRLQTILTESMRKVDLHNLSSRIVDRARRSYFTTALVITMLVIAIPMAIFMRAKPVLSYPGTTPTPLAGGFSDFAERLRQAPQHAALQARQSKVAANNTAANKPGIATAVPQKASLPLITLDPPQIIAAIPQSGSGVVSVHGYLAESTDIKKLNRNPRIRLYAVQLRGCELDPVAGDLLGETVVNADGSWTVEIAPGRSDLVTAVVTVDGRQSSISNLGLIVPVDKVIAIHNADQLQARAYPLTSDEGQITLSGKAQPFACLLLNDQNSDRGAVASAVASDKGEWNITAPLRDGENHFAVAIKGIENSPGIDVNLKAFQVRLQWPFGVYRDGKFVPSLQRKSYGDVILTAWYGKNDCQWFHDGGLADCYKLKTQEFHNGLDIYADWGTEVRALADGMIYYIQWDKTIGSGGNAVFIDHGAWSSVYLHLNYITIDPKWVKPYYRRTTRYLTTSQIPVKAGQVIGTVGNSGLKAAPGESVHLHVSAFTWAKGTREASLAGEYPNAGISTRRMGYTFNLNPPAGTTLQWEQNEIKAADLFTQCISDNDYWDVNWSQVEMTTSKGGTTFDDLSPDEDCSQPN
jgi:hypothetical protein